MYPVTVKQMVEAIPSSDDKSNFLIDGVTVYNVRFLIHPKLVCYHLICEKINVCFAF